MVYDFMMLSCYIFLQANLENMNAALSNAEKRAICSKGPNDLSEAGQAELYIRSAHNIM